MTTRVPIRSSLLVAVGILAQLLIPGSAAAEQTRSPYEGLVVASSTVLVRGEDRRPVEITVVNHARRSVAVDLPATSPSDEVAISAISTGTFDGHRWLIRRLRPGGTATLRYTPL